MQYTAQRVRSKTRNAVRRREDQIEQEEVESGELNLIPYLDMVTNLMLFMLASVSAGIVFSEIDTLLPDKAPPATSVAQPNQNPDDQPLKLFVSITSEKMIVWSASGLEGTLQEPKATFPRTGRDGDSCDGPYMCEGGYCNKDTQRCSAPPAGQAPPAPTPVFDYRALSNALFEIANRRYTGKQRKRDTYQIFLMADGQVPYATIASTMTAMRCKMPEFGKEPTGCAAPTDDKDALDRMRKAKLSVSPDGLALDVDTAVYDPSKMALFSDILFSTGFE
jgi:biopolymer transport protein ExbD